MIDFDPEKIEESIAKAVEDSRHKVESKWFESYGGTKAVAYKVDNEESVEKLIKEGNLFDGAMIYCIDSQTLMVYCNDNLTRIVG